MATDGNNPPTPECSFGAAALTRGGARTHNRGTESPSSSEALRAIKALALGMALGAALALAARSAAAPDR